MHKLINIFIIILFVSCNTTEPPSPPPPEEKPTLTLTLEDASSIEAWIKLTTNNLQLPATVTIKQNDTVVQDIVLQKKDSLIYIDSLLPKITYTFQAITQSSNQSITSNELSVTTMDTTSHEFTFETFTFGTIGSSVLRDVAIIDENNIWAVGEIYLNDSLGKPDPNAYNAIHWDGNSWKLLQLQFFTFCNQP
ncbi:MAG: glucosyl transferase, partial [Bacteroidetes bacterium]|nr:glucosyl transferase [Bacteroidota bacterium]